MCRSEENDLTLAYLTYQFPAGYEGPVPIPHFTNHSSALNLSRDVATYISKELGEGVMLSPFNCTSIHPLDADQPPSYQGQERLPSLESHHGPVVATPSWGQHQCGHPQRLFLGGTQ